MKNKDRRKTPKRILNVIDYLVIRCIEILRIMRLQSPDFYWANIYAREKTLLINANKLLKYRVIAFYSMTYFLRIYALFF